jgi:hypothetical protein
MTNNQKTASSSSGRFLTGRMTTGIERVFRQMPDGLYREVLLHWIHFMDDKGERVSSKIQKQIEGKLYKPILNEHDDKYRSIHGEVNYELPNGTTIRLVALELDYNDTAYGKGIR